MTTAPSVADIVPAAVVPAAVVTAPGKVELADRPLPELLPGTVLVDVHWVGLCGSDVHYFGTGRNGIFEIKEPLALGHELSGTVRAVAPDVVGGLTVGAPVAVHPAYPVPPAGATDGAGLNLYRGGSYLGSASTDPHTQGALTTVIRVAADQPRPLPVDLPLRRAALAEPLAVALHGVDRARERIAGARVLVSGAGPVGCLTVAALRERGARSVTVTDPIARALDVARACGADETHLVSELPTDQDGDEDGYDITVECAGAVPSLAACLAAARPGGAIVQLGILPAGDLPVPLAGLVSRELTLYGSQRFDIELDEAIRLLAAHPELDAVISHEFPLNRIAEAFATSADSRTSTKVLVNVADAAEIAETGNRDRAAETGNRDRAAETGRETDR
jgi:L-idonate 5-dehydrogenase